MRRRVGKEEECIIQGKVGFTAKDCPKSGSLNVEKSDTKRLGSTRRNMVLKEQCPGVSTHNFYKWRKCSLNVWENDFKTSN